MVIINKNSIIISVLLCAHTLLLICSATSHSPTFNEVGHLPAGLSHLKHGSFELYRVNPPLPRMLAAISLFFNKHKQDWKHHEIVDNSRAEVIVGIDFAEINGQDTFKLFTWGRLFCIPFSILGGMCCYWWARDLFGCSAGLLALIFWCFNPTIIGHGSLIMPDVPAAATGVLACYAFWTWIKSPEWPKTFLTGVLIGIAELTKFTLIVLYALLPSLWIVNRIMLSKEKKTTWYLGAVKVLLMFAVSIYLINLCYLFQGSFQKLGEYTFSSNTMTGANGLEKHEPGNVFRDSIWGELPIPLPKDYLLGIDRQKADFEYPRWSYLNGQWKLGGWWYFYLEALLIKSPSGMLIIYLTALALICYSAKFRLTFIDELFLILPIIVLFTLVSSQTAFSMHPRYTIPVIPFLFIWASRVALALQPCSPRIASAVVLSVTWMVSSSLYYFPHSLSYYNELVGGPEKGGEFMIDSPTAWGQDLLYLKQWCKKHPEAKPLHIANYGWVDPRAVGIKYSLPALAPINPVNDIGEDPIDYGPYPGWYIIDINHLKGTYWSAPMGNGTWEHFWFNYENKKADLTYFSKFKPVDRIAYSYIVYHISKSEANKIRSELGLPIIL